MKKMDCHFSPLIQKRNKTTKLVALYFTVRFRINILQYVLIVVMRLTGEKPKIKHITLDFI